MINIKSDGEPNVCLIDFGLSSKLLKDDEVHNHDQLLDNFEGNLLFSSLNQMQFQRTSRRDDLTQLFYMMTYLMNENKLVGSEISDDTLDAQDVQ